MFAALLSTLALVAAPGSSTHIDNPFWPMWPGTRWVYRETAPGAEPQRDVLTVTHRTRRVASGVAARVVHDRATEHGTVVEDTFDDYAQDRRGNISYLGEENYPGHALDGAQVLSRREQAEVPYGHVRRVLLTKNFNPLEPRALEYKLYARGVGPVLEIGISGDDDRAELVRLRRGRG